MKIYLRKARILIVFIALFSSGCAEFTKIMSGTGSSQNPSPVEYYLWVKSLQDSGPQREIQKLKKQKNSDPVIQQIQLALLQSVPETTTTEDKNLALSSLQRVLENSDKSPSQIRLDYLHFASLWKDIISYRLKQRVLTDNLNKQKSGVEEENRKLLKQIEALKSIEQQINKREINQDIEE